MPASAILSAPTLSAGAVSQPLSGAANALPVAQAMFGALVDAKTTLPVQPAPAASNPDPSATLVPSAQATLAADILPAIAAETGGEALPTTPATDVPGQSVAPVADKLPVPSTVPSANAGETQPAVDAEATPSEPAIPSAGQPVPAAQAQPVAPAASQEDAPPLTEEPADETGAEPGEILAMAQPPAAKPQPPIAAISPIVPVAQSAPAPTAQPLPDAQEAVSETRRSKAAMQASSATNGPSAGGKEAATRDAAPHNALGAAAPADVPATADQPDNGLPSPLLTQTMAPVTSRPAASAYPLAAQASTPAPVVQAQPGRIGADIGVEIARAAKGDREDLLIRLDPRDMGRINVRLSFDGDGVLRAVMSADSPAALDMLRRESGDLNRALADAGVRSDAQSLRFDARSGEQGQGGGQGAQREQHARAGGSQGAMGDDAGESTDPHYRPLRASGQVDLMA